MKVAITTDGRSVSKQFASTKGLEIFDVQKGKATSKMLVDASVGGGYEGLVYILQNEEVEVVLCGEIKANERKELEDYGLQVFPGARGSTTSILNAYLRSLKQSNVNSHNK